MAKRNENRLSEAARLELAAGAGREACGHGSSLFMIRRSRDKRSRLPLRQCGKVMPQTIPSPALIVGSPKAQGGSPGEVIEERRASILPPFPEPLSR
jgi:hypothetical protein